MGQTYGLSTVLLMVLATLPPAAAFVLILIFTRQRPRLSAGLSLSAVTLAVLAAALLLIRFWGLETPMVFNLRWFKAGSWTIPFGYLLDPLSLLMLTIVAVICWLVQFYSLGYMSGDPGFARYYAFMSLFAWAMLSLSLSSGLLQLYIFWELVGLSSYLLIGFWYEKFSASQAGKKAFVMTRLGDVAFFLGLLFLLLQVGNVEILELNRGATAARLGTLSVTLAALLIFGGIVGKSAQFPLLTWLPDAMEGPTPVSALLHSATMVAAGVFLFARLFPFFSHSSQAMAVFLAIGTLSMFSSATMAMVSRDIKRVWAYSTISQLGYMVMALAAGGYAAGVFHLTTHAGFKALLFLCSGVFIHHFGTNDMFEIGRRGGRQMKIPVVTMLVAAAALSGIPPLSGFFSKEFILETLSELDNPFWLGMALAGVFLTAYYTFRLIFVLLFARPAESPSGSSGSAAAEEEKHADRRADAFMAAPLIFLAVVTVGLGFALDPLKRHLGAESAAAVAGAGHHGWITPLSLILVAAAVGLAWIEFGRRGADQKGFVDRLPVLQRFFDQRWYLDHFYRFVLDAFVYRILSGLCTGNDRKVIDGGIDAFGRGTLHSGDLLSRLHAGMIQYRLLAIFAVLVMLGIYFIF